MPNQEVWFVDHGPVGRKLVVTRGTECLIHLPDGDAATTITDDVILQFRLNSSTLLG